MIWVLQVVQVFHAVLVVSSGGSGLPEVVVRMVRVVSVDDSENIWFTWSKPLNH